jgi:hypothetical protein
MEALPYMDAHMAIKMIEFAMKGDSNNESNEKLLSVLEKTRLMPKAKELYSKVHGGDTKNAKWEALCKKEENTQILLKEMDAKHSNVESNANFSMEKCCELMGYSRLLYETGNYEGTLLMQDVKNT